MGVADVITAVVGAAQIGPKYVGLGVGVTAVQLNADDTVAGVVPLLYEIPTGTLTVVNKVSAENAASPIVVTVCGMLTQVRRVHP